MKGRVDFVIPECYIDTNLVETLACPGGYNHQKGCNQVAKIMREKFNKVYQKHMARNHISKNVNVFCLTCGIISIICGLMLVFLFDKTTSGIGILCMGIAIICGVHSGNH